MLEPGYYANLFEVKLQSEQASVVACSRSTYPTLKSLREQVEQAGKEVYVYAPGHSDSVFGYGPDVDWLKAKGFQTWTVVLRKEPRLTGRMILDGVITKARTLGYTPSFPEIGRCRLFNWDTFRATSNGQVRVFLGYDIRVIFLRDQVADALTFNLVVDGCHAFRDQNDQPLNSQVIAQRFGSRTLRQVRQMQGDLIPTGINTEVSRQRLVEQIMPFVGQIGAFELPCGVRAQVLPEPLRVVVGAEDESLW